MHLHPDKVAERLGLHNDDSFKFESQSFDMARRLLDFTMRNYRRYVGQEPRLFRSGSYKMSPALVLAAGSLGIEALSNIRDNIGDPAVGGDSGFDREPFRWENGVLEIPVDLSSPERSTLESFHRRYDALTKRKRLERTCNIVMHSWSLTRRNEEGIHYAYGPEYEERFHQLIDHATRHGEVRTYSEYLDLRPSRPPVTRLSHFQPQGGDTREHVVLSAIATCIVCDTSFARRRMLESGLCPSCGSHASHRQLRQVFDNFGNSFDGKAVVAFDAARLKLWGFLAGASSVRDFDPKSAQDTDVATCECFVGLQLIKNKDDAITMIARVARMLTKGGVFVSMVPYRAKEMQPADEDVNGLCA